MRTECGIAKDLMPLCIDGVASEDSTRYVAEHIAECAPCAADYERMKAELPPAEAAATAREQAAFAHAAHMLRRKQQWRAWRIALIGALIGCLLLYGGYVGYIDLAVNKCGTFPADEYDITLAQLADGRLVISTDFHHAKRVYSPRYSTEGDYYGSGKVAYGNDSVYPTCVNIDLATTLLPTFSDSENESFPLLTLQPEELIALERITRCGSILVWQSGTAFPAASAEMEAYFSAEGELQSFEAALSIKYPASDKLLMNEEERVQWEALQSRADELYQLVPEWQ